MAEHPPPPHIGRQRYDGTRVLLLGGTGFIGPWVASALAQAGAEVTLAVRNLGRARSITAAFQFAPRLAAAPLADAAAVHSLFASVQPSITFNLAAYCAHPGQNDEAASALANVTLPRLVATAAAAHRDPAWPGATLVHTGTAEEYGPLASDLQEDVLPRPETLYGRTKLAGTRAVQDAAGTKQMPSIVARLFIVYGAGERPERLVPSLIAAASSGASVDLSAGRQRRDFTYVEDVADGLLRLGLTSTAPGTIVNLATGRARAVRTFVEDAASALGLRRTQLRFGVRAPHAGDVSHDDVSVTRLKALTGWTPPTTPADGIRRTAEWMARLSADSAADE